MSPESASTIPGDAPFDLLLDYPNVTEEIACLATTQQVDTLLPKALQVQDMFPVRLKSIDEIIAAYRKVSQRGFAERRLKIQVTK